MNRRGFGVVWGLVTLVVAGIVGVVAYNLGASSVVTSSATEAGRVVYYPGYGFGFGFFWLFPLLFFVLIFFGLFGRWGRWYGRGGWSGGKYGQGPGSYLDSWHQQAHGTPAPKTGPQTQQEGPRDA